MPVDVNELLADGLLWLNELMFDTVDGDKVTYRRTLENGTTYTVDIPRAVNVGKKYMIKDSKGVRFEKSDRQYAVMGRNLVLNGSRTEPKRGDQIVDIHEETYVDDGLAHVYEVLSLPNGEQAWDWDPLRLSLVINTKHVGTE